MARYDADSAAAAKKLIAEAESDAKEAFGKLLGKLGVLVMRRGPHRRNGHLEEARRKLIEAGHWAGWRAGGTPD